MFQEKIFLLLFFNIFALSAQIETDSVVINDHMVFDSILHIQKKNHLLGLKYGEKKSIYINGENISDTLYIYIQNNQLNDSISSTFELIEKDIKRINRKYYSEGFIFNKLVPAKIMVKKKRLKIYYNLLYLSKLNIDSIGYTNKLPGNIVRRLNKDFLNKTFSEATIENICAFISNNTIFSVTNTNILFKKNKNVLNISLVKQKQNTIDGLLGFGYDAQKKNLLINGEINSIIYNVFNANEKLQLRWQKTDNFQSYLIKTDFPNIFGSHFGINNTFQLQRKDTTEINIFDRFEFEWKHKSHKASIHLASEQTKGFKSSTNEIFIGLEHRYFLKPNEYLSKFGYKNKIVNSFSVNIPNNSKLFYIYNELLYSFATIKNQGVLFSIHNYISNSNNPNQTLSTINKLNRNSTIDFNPIKSIQLIESSYYFISKNQIFYSIHDLVNENTITNQVKSYINIGVGGQILRKNQNLTLNIYFPISLSKAADYQNVYISIKQLFRF
jgi:hypothetical protein